MFAAEILGEVNAFYIVIPGWDIMLHTINGFLAAAVGFSLAMLLNDNERIVFKLSPFFLSVVALCFSMTVGVIWEFLEFGMDMIFHTDAQKDTIIHAIYTVSLDTTCSNHIVAIEGIQDVLIDGESLGVGGCLDIGLIDTIKDLFVNFIGAVIFSAVGCVCIGKKSLWEKILFGFVPRKEKTRNQKSIHSSKDR